MEYKKKGTSWRTEYWETQGEEIPI
jgi:hypothetical protein